MALRWLPPEPGHRLLGRRVIMPGDIAPGRVEDYPEEVRQWLHLDAPLPDGPAEADAVPDVGDGEAARADGGPAQRPDLSALGWRDLAALAVFLGYDGESRRAVDTVPYLNGLPAADVAAALARMAD